MFTDTQRKHGVSVSAPETGPTVQALQGRAEPPRLTRAFLSLSTYVSILGGGGGSIVEVLPGADSVPLGRWGLKSGAVTCQTAGMLMPWLR